MRIDNMTYSYETLWSCFKVFPLPYSCICIVQKLFSIKLSVRKSREWFYSKLILMFSRLISNMPCVSFDQFHNIFDFSDNVITIILIALFLQTGYAIDIISVLYMYWVYSTHVGGL